MKKKIEKLTKEQEAKFAEYRDRWIAIGLAEEQRGFDRAKPEAAVRLAYRSAGLPEPQSFIWTESPLHTGVAYAMLKNTSASVGASVGASVRASVGDSVWASVGDSVWDSVGASVYGSHEAGWLSFYRFFHDECGIDCSKLAGLWECANVAGWFVPFANAAIISPRPYAIRTRKNDRGVHELHADGEPAVFYCDDFKIYANSGVRLPEQYGAVKASDWKSEWLLKETNAELRMVLLKGIGYERMCQDLQPQKVDAWREYNLLRFENVDVEPVVLVTMTCPSTQKLHALRVPPDVQSARQAITLCNRGIDPETFVVEH